MHRAKNFSDIPERLAALTERQQQVATLVRGGLSNKTIAQKLGVSEGTVKAHLHAIYDKLRLRSRTQIIIALGTVQSQRPID